MNSDCVWLPADDLHQDAGFLVGDARRSLLRHGGANVALALDRSDALCGGFEVLGGTHALGSVQDLKGRYDTGGADDEALFDQSQRTRFFSIRFLRTAAPQTDQGAGGAWPRSGSWDPQIRRMRQRPKDPEALVENSNCLRTHRVGDYRWYLNMF